MKQEPMFCLTIKNKKKKHHLFTESNVIMIIASSSVCQWQDSQSFEDGHHECLLQRLHEKLMPFWTQLQNDFSGWQARDQCSRTANLICSHWLKQQCLFCCLKQQPFLTYLHYERKNCGLYPNQIAGEDENIFIVEFNITYQGFQSSCNYLLKVVMLYVRKRY